MNYKKILRSLVLGLGMVLVMGGAVYAVTTVVGTLQFTGGVAGATEKIDFDSGGSKIWDDWMLHIATDDHLYLDVPGTTYISGALNVTGLITGTVSGTTTSVGTTSTVFTFGSGSDADLTDMTLNIGGTDPAILQWTASTHLLSFTDNLAITGTLGVTGATTLGGALAVAGNATFDEDVTLGNQSDDNVTIPGTIYLGGYGVTLKSEATNGLRVSLVAQTETANAQGAYIYAIGKVASTGGEIRGAEIKAKANSGALDLLTGLMINADSKSATLIPIMRGAEIKIENTAGTVTKAVGLEINNGFQGTITESYGIQISAPGTVAYTADIKLSSGAYIKTGAGVPSGACVSGSIYLNSSAAAVDTALYTCISSLWDAVTN